MELNETKLANTVKARDLRPATEDEIVSIGAVPGFASPITITPVSNQKNLGKNVGVMVVIDDSIPSSPNLVAGANETGYHLLNTNFPRDYRG